MMVRVLLEEPPARKTKRVRSVDLFRWGFLFIGLVACGFSAYVYLDSRVYQAYEDWSFDRAAQGKAPSVSEFLKDEVGQQDVAQKDDRNNQRARGEHPPAPSVKDSLFARIAIPRLNVKAIVREGVDDKTLRRAVGHVPGTAWPGDDGNVGLAGHRDSFFRPLHDVRRDDRILVETLDATYEYAVDSIKIVGPDDVSVLAPTKEPSLTLVTCYPFHYVGNAPRRFIVRARQVNVEARAGFGVPGRSGL